MPAITLAVNTTAPQPIPVIENDSYNYTNSGSIKLSWHSQSLEVDNSTVIFELQRALSADFSDAHLYYKGPDLATYISGLSDGHYFFRIRQVDGDNAVSEWSSSVEVEVEHHSLNLAFTLFGVGGLVFILTVIIVFTGAARTRDPDASPGSLHQSIGG